MVGYLIVTHTNEYSRGFRVPSAETPISEHDLEMGFEDLTDPEQAELYFRNTRKEFPVLVVPDLHHPSACLLMKHHWISMVLSRIDLELDKERWEEVDTDPRASPYRKWKYINVEEAQFLECILKVIQRGDSVPEERTGVGCYRISGTHLRFSMENHTFPLMTTKNQPLRQIFEELKWCLLGKTDVASLHRVGVHVWDTNASTNYRDRVIPPLQLELPEGELGRTYGYQWRSWSQGGCDQLERVVKLLRTNPFSRRNVVSLWNPCDETHTVLPPCLMMYQFIVSPQGELDCVAYNRSSDIAVAGGWNISTAALLTVILANLCDLTPRDLIWNAGDVHIYYNNVVHAVTLGKRVPNHPFPKLYLNKKLGKLSDLETLEYKDLELVHYNTDKGIRFNLN